MSWLEDINCTIKVNVVDGVITADAPSNIALIKYMGKLANNVADNPSLSYTLDKCRVKVQLTPAEDWSWQPLVGDIVLKLSEQKRFIDFAKLVVQRFAIKTAFTISSAGNFPMNCGIASSAASFAALTAALLFQENLSLAQVAAVSQQGSGSSCRSFLAPWVKWDNTVSLVNSKYVKLLHYVVIVSNESKLVTSSQAHHLVKTSLLYASRTARVKIRFNAMQDALIKGDWQVLFDLSWQEFWDMHALFNTANPSFSYFIPATIAVLNQIKAYWDKYKDGPIVTLDAGANVHLLFRLDQQDVAQYLISSLTKFYQVI